MQLLWQFGGSLKMKNRITMWSSNSTFGHILKITGSRVLDIHTPMFMAALFTLVKRRKKPQCLSTWNGWTKCGIYIQRNVIQFSKETLTYTTTWWTLRTWCEVKQARHTNRQTLNDSTYEVFGEVKFIERENRMAVARGCTLMRMYLILLNCTLKSRYDGKSYPLFSVKGKQGWAVVWRIQWREKC